MRDARDKIETLGQILKDLQLSKSKLQVVYSFVHSFRFVNGLKGDDIWRRPPEIIDSELYTAAVQFFLDVEQLRSEWLGNSQHDVSEMSQLIQELIALLDELDHLQEFYTHFRIAYSKVLNEMEYRQAFSEKRTKLVNDSWKAEFDKLINLLV